MSNDTPAPAPEPEHWSTDPGVYLVLVPEHALAAGEEPNDGLARLFKDISRGHVKEMMPLEDPRFVEAVDITFAKFPPETAKILDRDRGIFELPAEGGGVAKRHLRVMIVRPPAATT